MIVVDYKCKCNIVYNTILHFQQNFKNWTSGNKDIDKFIQDIQLSAHHDASKALEWISYNRFRNIRYVKKGRFCETYEANWIDGNISHWDNENQNWVRYNQNMFVTLKSLSNLKNFTSEVMNEV
jgi:hypothetical protein